MLHERADVMDLPGRHLSVGLFACLHAGDETIVKGVRVGDLHLDSIA